MSDKKLSLLVNFIGVDKMTGSLTAITAAGKKARGELVKMERDAKQLDKQLIDVRNELAKGGMRSGLALAERELKIAIQETNEKIVAQKRLLSENSDQLARAQRIAAITARASQFQQRGTDLRQRGQDNMLGGVGMATPLILAAKAGMDFSSVMVDIQQKAEMTNAETDQMRRRILAIGKASHQLSTDVASGVDVLSGFGLDPREAIKMIGPISRIGTAFKVELADGASAAYANLNNLKVPISETARALDIMAAGGNAGAFEVKDMAKQFPGLTARMQALGQTGLPAVADLTAALQVAMSTARDADEAGNNIQNLLAKINAKATTDAFKKNFGVDLPAALKAGLAKGQTSMEAFATIANKATRGDLKKLGWGVEDMQAQMALMALIQNMDKYRKIRSDIANASGTVDKAFALREARDGTVAWRDFMGAVQRLGITLGNGFLPAATRFLSVANSMIGYVASLAQAYPGLTTALMSLVGGLVAARIAWGAMQFAVGGAFGPLATVYSLFKQYNELGSLVALFPKIAGGFAFIANAAGKVGPAIATLMTLLRGLALFMLTNPAGLFLLAVGAGVAAYQNWDWIKEKLGLGGAGAPATRNWSNAGAAAPARNPRLPAIAPVRPAGSALAAAAARGPITVQVFGAKGQSEEAIADHVIRKMDHAQGVKARSNMNGEDGR